MDTDIQRKIDEQMATLPEVVRRVLESADTNALLQKIAQKHRLTLDKWQILENEVRMTLMGLVHPSELEDNIVTQVGVERTLARELATDIAIGVFDPLRAQLERELGHPETEEVAPTAIEQITKAVLRESPHTPPADVTRVAETPQAAIQRATTDPSYHPTTNSTERKDVRSDPYREAV